MKKLLLILIVMTTTLTLSACNTNSSEQDTIYTTIFPIYDVTRSLTEDLEINVEYVLPPGVSPHSYDPSPATLVAMLDAAIILYSDEELEPWVANMLGSTDFGSVPSLRLSDYVTLIEAGEDHSHEEDAHSDEDHPEEETHTEEDHDHEYDPHYWSDPRNMIVIATAVADKLMELFPEEEATIRLNQAAYVDQMNEVHEAYERWEQYRTTDILMHGGHNSIGYMVAAYHVTYVNPYEGFSADAEPTPQAIASMIEQMELHQTTHLFSEVLLSQTVANTLSEQTGAEILMIYAMSNVTQDDYEAGITMYDMMMHNLEQYKIGLGYNEPS